MYVYPCVYCKFCYSRIIGIERNKYNLQSVAYLIVIMEDIGKQIIEIAKLSTAV